jgi:hypothetical protein
LGAQHRGEATLREHRAHDLGKGRKDRVLQLRQYEPDESGPLPTQLRGPFIAQDVEGSEWPR